MVADVLTRPRCVGCIPFLKDKAGKGGERRPVDILGRQPACGFCYNRENRRLALAGVDPSGIEQMQVKNAVSREVVIIPAVRPTEPPGGFEPVCGDIGPEEQETAFGLFLNSWVGELPRHEPETIEIDAVIGGAEKFSDPVLPGEVDPLIEHGGAFLNQFRPFHTLSQGKQIPGFHQVDIRIADIDLLPVHAFNRSRLSPAFGER